MQLWVNAAQMKAADQYTIQKLGVPSLELMEHAAQAPGKEWIWHTIREHLD